MGPEVAGGMVLQMKPVNKKEPKGSGLQKAFMCSIEFGTFFSSFLFFFFLIAMNDNVASATPPSPVQARIFLIGFKNLIKSPAYQFYTQKAGLILSE